MRFFTGIVFLSVLNLSMAQNQFKAGASVALPIGDASRFSSIALAFDFSYQFRLSEDLYLGPFVSYSVSFGDSIDSNRNYENVQFLPLGGALRYEVLPRAFIGLDMGYGIGIEEDISGGLYFSPRMQYRILDRMDIVAAYRGISRSGLTWDIIGLGVEFSLE